MIIKNFVVGGMANNNYLLVDNNEAVLIDCTSSIPELDSVLKEYNATLKYILLTHSHFDHIGGVVELQKKYNLKVGIHKAEKENLENTPQFLKKYNLSMMDIPKADFYFDEGDEIKFGNEVIKVISLSGHTVGGAGFVIENYIFSGDTIFLGSVGRTDLPTGNLDDLKKSIKTKIFTLPDDTIIYTGHGAQTSVGNEKKYNSFV
jgi:glyoxylase-like metal-dependent hydrolase (beta-lactamase superfamily II)